MFYLLADRAVADQPGLPVWADLGLLVGAAIITLPAALHARHRTRDIVPVPWPAVGCGLLDAVADLALLVALQRGPFSAVSVLSNLDPVIASLLALWLLHERPGPRTGLAATTMVAGSLLLSV